MYFIIPLLWILNLELNPSIGGIWLRSDQNGDTIIVFQNIINLLKAPFQYDWFWNIRMWDINWITFFIISFILIKFIFKKKKKQPLFLI